jgi:cell cycle sensor histidine kinase DivJ
LSATAVRRDAWLAGVKAGCERLVHPDVIESGERARQRRFIGVALGAPFVMAPALVQAFADTLAGPALLAAACAVFASAWMFATMVAVTGRRSLAEPLALAFATALVAVTVAGSGGIGHPATLLALALAFESWWIGAKPRRVLIGGAAAFAVLPLSIAAGWWPGIASPGLSAWAWIAPLLYCASVAPRLVMAVKPAAGAAGNPTLQGMAEAFGTAVLKLTPSGEVVDASEDAGTLLGLPAGLMVGRSLFERVHVGDRVAFMNTLANMNVHAGRRSVELRLRAAGGESGARDRFVPVSLELIRTGPDAAELTVLVRDNTVLASLRDELEKARQTADSNEVAKNRFMAAISHELRTPLNSIIGFSEMMLNDMAGSLAGQQREYVGLISSSGRHLLSVVNAILDVSRIESGAYSIAPEPFPIGEAVEFCQSMMAHQAEAQGLSLTVSVRPDVREITADRRAVQQVIINLLSNAIKFTPAGGSVSLDVYRLGGRLNFVVSDSGIGIAECDLGKLGRPFTQLSNDVSRQYEGAGLGLSLVKGLVALHEGELAIESAPGEGTVVTVTLPVDGPGERQTGGFVEPASATVHKMDPKVRDETVRKTA